MGRNELISGLSWFSEYARENIRTIFGSNVVSIRRDIPNFEVTTESAISLSPG